MKKRSVSRFTKPTVKKSGAAEGWHGGADAEINLYARSLQKAALSLARALESQPGTRTPWDVCPIIWLYRQALELQLKALVGEGSNFLKSKTDPISLYRSHSLRWLAQVVCQVIKTVGWESDFACEGVSNLTEFNSLVNEVESLEPVSRAVHFANASGYGSVTQTFQKIDALEFARKLDALLELLEVTADALAATWEQRAEVAVDGDLGGGNNFGPTIH